MKRKYWYCAQSYFDNGKVFANVISQNQAEKMNWFGSLDKNGGYFKYEASRDFYVDRFDTQVEAEQCEEEAYNA